MKDTPPNRLYTPLEAVTVLEPIYSGSTKELIADKLKDGFISAFASNVWRCDRSPMPKLSQIVLALEEGDQDIEKDVWLDKKVWRRSRYWLEDFSNWRWDEARVLLTRRKKAPADRTIITGLRLLADDVDAIAASQRNKGGKPTEYEGWGHAFCAILELEKAGSLNPGKVHSIAQLADKIETHLPRRRGRPLLASETLRKALRPVWDRINNASRGEIPDN